MDGVKIDQSFVAAIEKPGSGGGLAAAVIAMGRALGMSVVAEGVETQAQLDFLARHDCDAVQGYLTGKPIDAASFAELLRADQAD